MVLIFHYRSHVAVGKSVSDVVSVRLTARSRHDLGLVQQSCSRINLGPKCLRQPAQVASKGTYASRPAPKDAIDHSILSQRSDQ